MKSPETNRGPERSLENKDVLGSMIRETLDRYKNDLTKEEREWTEKNAEKLGAVFATTRFFEGQAFLDTENVNIGAEFSKLIRMNRLLGKVSRNEATQAEKDQAAFLLANHMSLDGRMAAKPVAIQSVEDVGGNIEVSIVEKGTEKPLGFAIFNPDDGAVTVGERPDENGRYLA